MEDGNLQQALQTYLQCKGLAEFSQNLVEKMKVYGQIGNCYKLMRNYKKALINYKKMVQLS